MSDDYDSEDFSYPEDAPADSGGGGSEESWGGLDQLGGSARNVADKVLNAYGNLFTKQINNRGVKTPDQRPAVATTRAPKSNPNAARTYWLIGGGVAATLVVWWLIFKR